MTDPELAHRAEQAYLGALIARQGEPGTGTTVAGSGGPGAFSGLRPGDFADPVHQAVYAALASQAQPPQGILAAAWERLRGALTRLASARAREAAGYMAGLPGRCPDPAHMPAYAAMVSDASRARAAAAPAAPIAAPAARPASQQQQQATAEDPRLASAAQWLDAGRARRRQPAAQETDPGYTAPPSRPRPAPGGVDRQTARLARALGADVRRLAARPSPPAVPPPAQAGDRAAPLTAGALQEQVLADLMLHPAGRGDVASWLPARAFTAGNNRDLYELVSMRLLSGRPVDPLIMAWDAAALPGEPDPAAARGEPLAAAALRLGALNPAPGTAAVLAPPLYAEQICIGALGPDWRKEPRPIPATDPAPVPATAHAAAPAADQARAAAPAQAGQGQAAGPRPGPAEGAASPSWSARAPAGRPAPASPRHASGLPLRRPPAPGPAAPGPEPAR